MRANVTRGKGAGLVICIKSIDVYGQLIKAWEICEQQKCVGVSKTVTPVKTTSKTLIELSSEKKPETATAAPLPTKGLVKYHYVQKITRRNQSWEVKAPETTSTRRQDCLRKKQERPPNAESLTVVHQKTVDDNTIDEVAVALGSRAANTSRQGEGTGGHTGQSIIALVLSRICYKKQNHWLG